MTRAGVVDLARYEPSGFLSADDIASASGIPAEVIRDRFGLAGKHVAGPDEHVSDMCIAAARALLERHDPTDIDCVAYFGSHWKDHAVWQAAPKVQHALGIDGYSLELINVSAGAPIAVKVVADMLTADESLGTVLLVGACKESGLIDFANERARFMFTFGDGAVAVLLRRDHARNIVLGSSLLTDGSFSEFVHVPAGGSVHPASHQTIEQRMHYLDVIDPAEMKRRLDPVTMKNFLRVAREAAERSDCDLADIDWLLPIHMKRSIHDALLVELGIDASRSVYLDHNGHMSAVDPLFALSMLHDDGRLADGDLVMLLAAGTGYTWAASVIRWGAD
ncbi:MAG TPA: 3-oxoacyl-ACP synthase [Actinomycetota bacterium]